MRRRSLATALVGGFAVIVAAGVPAVGQPTHPSHPSHPSHPAHPAHPAHGPRAPKAGSGGGATFATGQLQAQTVGAKGCGTNNAGEPAIHVSKTNLVALGSENG